MKQFLVRLAVYIPIISVFWWILVPSFFNPEPFPGPLVAQAIGYITFYGIGYGFWIGIYELSYRAAVYVRKPKPLPVPDTQPLSTIQQVSNPTMPLDSP